MDITPFAPTSTAPVPGASSNGRWQDFLRDVLHDVGDILSPEQRTGYEKRPGYGGTGEVLNGGNGGSGVLGLVVVAVIVWLVIDAA